MNNSEPVDTITSIFIGLGVVTLIIIALMAIIFIGPAFLGGILTLVHLIAWIVIFCLVIILPLWIIGKVCKKLFGKR